MNYISKFKSSWQGLLIVFVSASVVSIAHGQPVITGVNGTVAHSNSMTISGSGFGTKNTQHGAAPVAFGNMENNSLNASIGSWSTTNLISTVSTSHQRNSHSNYNSVCNIIDQGGGQDFNCAFTGGSDSPQWFVQWWFYLDSDFTWASGDGNNKIFRMWSSGSNMNNLVVLAPLNRVNVGVETVDNSHGSYYSGSCPPTSSAGWYPVIPGGSCIDALYGHACNCSDWLPGSTEWRNFSTDIGRGTWHLTQFEFQSSDVNTANGIFRWWVDGKLVFSRSDFMTRTSANPSHMRPKYVGIEAIHNSGGHGAVGHYYIDDAYIDNTWQRVEIGNNANYNSCTLKEIQLLTAWSDTSITFTVNQGSFANGATGYIFVTDASGTRNTGRTVTFGSSGGTDVTPVQNARPTQIIP